MSTVTVSMTLSLERLMLILAVLMELVRAISYLEGAVLAVVGAWMSLP